MTTLYFIRHGQTDWNIEGRWQGHADVPMNARGRQQAARIARSLADVGLAAIYSSDLQRAAETAQAISLATHLPVRHDPRLREINQGEWQGLLASQVQAHYGELLRKRQQDPLTIAPPGGESVLQVRDRLVSAVEDILARHPNERVAVVSHGFALAVLQVHYQGYPIEKAWDFIPSNDEWRVLEIASVIPTNNI